MFLKQYFLKACSCKDITAAPCETNAVDKLINIFVPGSTNAIIVFILKHDLIEKTYLIICILVRIATN